MSTKRRGVSGLSAAENDVVRRALIASADGPFFSDAEFHTLFGQSRAEVRALVERWPTEAHGPALYPAVSNALNNLSGYPISNPAELAKFGLERDELSRVLGKLQSGYE